MSKYIPKQYISSFNPKDISKNFTILNNDKSEILKSFNKALLNRNIFDSINNAIELHASGYFDIVLNKLSSIYFNDINIANIHGLNYISQFMNYYINTYSYKDKKRSGCPKSCIYSHKYLLIFFLEISSTVDFMLL